MYDGLEFLLHVANVSQLTSFMVQALINPFYIDPASIKYRIHLGFQTWLSIIREDGTSRKWCQDYHLSIGCSFKSIKSNKQKTTPNKKYPINLQIGIDNQKMQKKRTHHFFRPQLIQPRPASALLPLRQHPLHPPHHPLQPHTLLAIPL